MESALKEDVCTERSAERGGRFIFINPCRRDILSILTLVPCQGAAEISRKINVNLNTVMWHIDVLIARGYVLERRFGSRRVFFPEGLISGDEVGLFHAIKRFRSRTVLSDVMDVPGMSGTELVRHTNLSRQTLSKSLRSLERQGLVSAVADGSRNRYYPTNLLAERGEAFYERSKGFADFLLNKIGGEGGESPVIIKKGLDRLIIEIGPRGSRSSMEIGINPYLTAL